MKKPRLAPIKTVLKTPTLWCVFVNLLTIFFVLVISDKLPPVVPLFYGRPQATEQLASKSFLLIPPAIGLGLTIINFFIARALSDSLLRNILYGLMVVVTALSTITVIKIIFLVGSL